MCESLPFMAQQPRGEDWQHIDLQRLQAADDLHDLERMSEKKIKKNDKLTQIT